MPGQVRALSLSILESTDVKIRARWHDYLIWQLLLSQAAPLPHVNVQLECPDGDGASQEECAERQPGIGTCWCQHHCAKWIQYRGVNSRGKRLEINTRPLDMSHCGWSKNDRGLRSREAISLSGGGHADQCRRFALSSAPTGRPWKIARALPRCRQRQEEAARAGRRRGIARLATKRFFGPAVHAGASAPRQPKCDAEQQQCERRPGAVKLKHFTVELHGQRFSVFFQLSPSSSKRRKRRSVQWPAGTTLAGSDAFRGPAVGARRSRGHFGHPNLFKT